MNQHESQRSRILIVDDDNAFRVATVALLREEGYSVRAVKGSEEAKRALSEESYDLILSDLVMEHMNGIDLLRYIRQTLPDATVMMITGFGSVQTAVDAMRSGAFDYITKPCNNDELVIKIKRAVDESRRAKELVRLRNLLQGEANFSNVITRNEKMKDVFKLIRQVAETDVTVLVLGETGTGKELVSKAIHLNSSRRDMPFVIVQCSAIPSTLLESELFGYEKGAFTGAMKLHRGKIEEAEGGTLFLDEIGDVSLELQTKLLRILQEKQFSRLGSNASITADIRIIAATHRHLDEMVKEGKFREDLLYRLNVFPITLPSLRERLDDIPILAEFFLEKHRSLARREITGFTPAAIHDMMNYDWKGNVRELENLIKRAIIKSDDATIKTLELQGVQPDAGTTEPLDPPQTTALPYKSYIEHVVRDAELKYLQRLLKECKGNLNQVARIMDVDRKTVYRKLEDYSIDPSLFRE
ncbi:MAG TPA: sigma-54 dependent transcriptional regulator [Bacteroidota bacterium]|nr:sigma-54 dependent transcriptional regulator [Bacteroidota bacterium]